MIAIEIFDLAEERFLFTKYATDVANYDDATTKYLIMLGDDTEVKEVDAGARVLSNNTVLKLNRN